jgi:hypothetical protein
LLLALLLLLCAGAAVAQEKKTAHEIPLNGFEKLMDKEMKTLEKEDRKPAHPESAPSTADRTDISNGALQQRLADIEKRLTDAERYKPVKPTTFGTRGQALPTTATGFNRLFNPAISFNGLFLAAYRSQENQLPDSEIRTGFAVQELEVNAGAYIDNYLRGQVTLAVENLETIHLEETYVDIVPTMNLNIRVGKYYTPFGKHNLLHHHQFLFIDAPLINQRVLGEESLNEAGVALNYLIPTPWFSEVNVHVLDGRNPELFNSRYNDDLAYLFHAKNLWDVNENTTLELGQSYAFGNNNTSAYHHRTDTVGADLTLIWRPLNRARFNKLVWQTEYLARFKEGALNPETGIKGRDDDLGGVYTLLQYQFLQRWWVQGRYDYVGLNQSDRNMEKTNRYGGMLVFANSEFQAVRLQYDYTTFEDGTRPYNHEHRVMLQLNFSMGSHPAHFY